MSVEVEFSNSKRSHVANSEGRLRQDSRLDSVVKKSHSASPRRSLTVAVAMHPPCHTVERSRWHRFSRNNDLGDAQRRFLMWDARIVLVGISPIGEKSAVEPDLEPHMIDLECQVLKVLD